MILVIDNYDSFTYNLVQFLGELGADVVVKRNDEVTLDEIVALDPQGIVLSPGPCTPDRSGVCLSILGAALTDSKAHHDFFSRTPIFGVCLGLQATGAIAGGLVIRARHIKHGKTSMIEHNEKGVLAGIPSPFCAIRYHSLVVKADSVPDTFEVTARSLDDGEVMALKHKSLSIEGVQFHPESIGTQHGKTIIANFLSQVASSSA